MERYIDLVARSVEVIGILTILTGVIYA